jgi:hypothetical protein
VGVEVNENQIIAAILTIATSATEAHPKKRAKRTGIKPSNTTDRILAELNRDSAKR